MIQVNYATFIYFSLFHMKTKSGQFLIRNFYNTHSNFLVKSEISHLRPGSRVSRQISLGFSLVSVHYRELNRSPNSISRIVNSRTELKIRSREKTSSPHKKDYLLTRKKGFDKFSTQSKQSFMLSCHYRFWGEKG